MAKAVWNRTGPGEYKLRDTAVTVVNMKPRGVDSKPWFVHLGGVEVSRQWSMGEAKSFGEAINAGEAKTPPKVAEAAVVDQTGGLIPMSRDEFVSVLGEGIHTALRKATDSDHGDEAWSAINRMDDREWTGVLEFFASGLEVMGYKFDGNAALLPVLVRKMKECGVAYRRSDRYDGNGRPEIESFDVRSGPTNLTDGEEDILRSVLHLD